MILLFQSLPQIWIRPLIETEFLEDSGLESAQMTANEI